MLTDILTKDSNGTRILKYTNNLFITPFRVRFLYKNLI